MGKSWALGSLMVWGRNSILPLISCVSLGNLLTFLYLGFHTCVYPFAYLLIQCQHIVRINVKLFQTHQSASYFHITITVSEVYNFSFNTEVFKIFCILECTFQKFQYQNSFQRNTSLILSLRSGEITAMQSCVIGSTSQEFSIIEFILNIKEYLYTFGKMYSHCVFKNVSSNHHFWSTICTLVQFLVLGIPWRTGSLLSLSLPSREQVGLKIEGIFVVKLLKYQCKLCCLHSQK